MAGEIPISLMYSMFCNKINYSTSQGSFGEASVEEDKKIPTKRCSEIVPSGLPHSRKQARRTVDVLIINGTQPQEGVPGITCAR